ncbi:hypothetical protein ACFT12_30300 [Streptomyces griseoincarnatus]
MRACPRPRRPRRSRGAGPAAQHGRGGFRTAVALPGTRGTGHRKLQFLLACAAVLVASLILTLCSPSGDGTFVASSVTSGLALLASFAALLRNWTPAEIAALRTPVAVGALAFLPGVSLRFARLPIGFEMPDTAPRSTYGNDPRPHEPVDAERIRAQARRGHELLVGLAGGCSPVAAGAALVLAVSGGLWAQLLALATGVAALMRAQLCRMTRRGGPRGPRGPPPPPPPPTPPPPGAPRGKTPPPP